MIRFNKQNYSGDRKANIMEKDKYFPSIAWKLIVLKSSKTKNGLQELYSMYFLFFFVSLTLG